MATVIKFATYLRSNTSIAPLVVFRIAFGALMFLSVSRFMLKGWVSSMYIQPRLFFPYYGFEWIKPLPGAGMYVVYVLLLIASLGILLGAFYRLSTLLFFLLFTYVELIDKTNYLNHYYFISVVSFMLLFIPAHRSFSFDNKRLKLPEATKAPVLFSFILKLQMFLVYFFAGVAKLNSDWLLEAQPLRIWLPSFSHFPVIGGLMEQNWLAFFFSWISCIYDLVVGFFLFNKRTVKIAYVFVVIFHLATALLFNIGMFPYIMMTITIIFFPNEIHQTIVNTLKKIVRYTNNSIVKGKEIGLPKILLFVFSIYFIIQVILPFRYLLYPGKLFWTEQGYRFSWRVMLMEKAGTAFFYVKDKTTGRQTEIDNKEYLTFLQEKMMATQPDMMVDYAKFLKQEYIRKGYSNPIVTAQSYVTLNGCPSRELIDPSVDLSEQSNSFFKNKTWIKNY